VVLVCISEIQWDILTMKNGPCLRECWVGKTKRYIELVNGLCKLITRGAPSCRCVGILPPSGRIPDIFLVWGFRQKCQVLTPFLPVAWKEPKSLHIWDVRRLGESYVDVHYTKHTYIYIYDCMYVMEWNGTEWDRMEWNVMQCNVVYIYIYIIYMYAKLLGV
jgi:hypothetical protein